MKADGELFSDDTESMLGRLRCGRKLRENLIKKCRDSQKAAKQSIFAIHRGDASKALQLLRHCAHREQDADWILELEKRSAGSRRAAVV